MTVSLSDSALLDGIRVVDLASVGPAARASRWLADFGAEVIKVGPMARDSGVQITPPAYAYSAHRGMRPMSLDLKADAGRLAFLRLVQSVDVVIESFRPGVVDRLGVGYEALSAENPGVVLCSTTGYGQDGPRSQWAGHDLNYLAVSGYLHCSGRTGRGGPALPGATVADSAAGGLQAVASICAALVRRSQTGVGAHLDVSIADGALSLMSLAVDEFFATGKEPGPGHGLLTGQYAWYDVYECEDGRWLAVAAIEGRFFENLCRGLDCPEWIGRQYDTEAVDAMRAAFRTAFATRPRDQWVAQLGPSDTCVSAVNDVPDLVEDAQYIARDAFVGVDHPTEGEFTQVGLMLAGQAGVSGLTVPDMSESRGPEVLAGAGFAQDEIDELITAGVVG